MSGDALPDRSSRIGAVYRFTIAVAISATITIGLPILLVSQMKLYEELAVAIAMVTAFFVNFFINKRYVFRSDHRGSRQLLRFFLTNVLMRIVDYLGFLVMFRYFGLHYVVSLFVVLTLTTVVRFFMFSRIFSKT